jgi:serine/threonine-protein kinase
VTQPALLPLSLLEKYRLESRLGSGGFGVVYAATELRLSRRVALKTLPRISGERVERFKREALAAAAIQHPNLAMIHTAESWNETPILVFELLEGGTLAQRLMRSPLSVVETLELGRAMAGVLEEAHKRGILHRDIKPSNIGYDARRTPKLLDFGVARIRDPATPSPARPVETITLDRLREPEGEVPLTQDAPLTETGAIVGTPAYMPLEAYQHGEPGPAFDLWALSVTLYESLAGINPFRAPTPAETIERLLRENPAPLREVRPDCPPALSDLLARALSRSANDRPRSAAEFKDALVRLEVS